MKIWHAASNSLLDQRSLSLSQHTATHTTLLLRELQIRCSITHTSPCTSHTAAPSPNSKFILRVLVVFLFLTPVKVHPLHVEVMSPATCSRASPSLSYMHVTREAGPCTSESHRAGWGPRVSHSKKLALAEDHTLSSKVGTCPLVFFLW